MAFIASAVPGAIIAFLILFFMREPKRVAATEKHGVDKQGAASLVKNRAYLCAILGYAAVTFALGGISFWIPAFLQRFNGRDIGAAGTIMGTLTVVCGLGGTVVGGVVAQWWSKRTGKALYYVPALSAALAVPPAVLTFFGPSSWTLPALGAAVFFIFLGTGPVNAATLNAVPANLRSIAMAGQLFALHVFGDMAVIVGDWRGERQNESETRPWYNDHQHGSGCGDLLPRRKVRARVAPYGGSCVIADAPELWRTGLQTLAWLIAGAWVWKAADVVRNMPRMPNLTDISWDRKPEHPATLTVVVPARDEEEKIAATIDALMQADYPALHVLVIDDRSTDKTGMIVDASAAEYATRMPGRLNVIHVTDLPEGWLGKTFALQVATENSASEFLLYTDADVLFSPSILRRAMLYMEAERADHLVVLPTMQVLSRGEGIVLGFFQILGMWAARPWRVADEKAQDAIGCRFVQPSAASRAG